ncbi:MAG: enoyl-CoA hydratase/isomerase family protein [Gammaproteobacteria bacterium]|nr:enoyl-CoA hydratase/isomerase family protein [Gammaproteobacteria bacterium]
MSSAIAINQNRSSSPQATANGKGGVFRSTKNFQLLLEPRRRTASWVLRANAPSFVTKDLISEILDLQKIFSSPRFSIFEQRILRSNVPGIFSLGGDLAFFKSCVQSGDDEALLDYAMKSGEVIASNVESFRLHKQLTVCVVQGEAQGGGFELALSSHVLIAERGTCFGFPEPLFGLFPGMGAEPLLETRIGAKKSKAILGAARRWTAEQLFDMGVIDFLAEPGQGLAATNALISTIGEKEREFYGRRFELLAVERIRSEVSVWANQAMKLSSKNFRTIDLILKAQSSAANRRRVAARG